MNTIAIIGGGASGMMAAIFAARKGAKVLLLEQNDRLGKKILVTGNGRCNYTNTYQDASCYRSEQPDFITRVLDQFPVEKVIAFFRELGIYPKDRNGYLYPYSDQASAIRDVLEQEVTVLELMCVQRLPAPEYRKQKIDFSCRPHRVH